MQVGYVTLEHSSQVILNHLCNRLIFPIDDDVVDYS